MSFLAAPGTHLPILGCDVRRTDAADAGAVTIALEVGQLAAVAAGAHEEPAELSAADQAPSELAPPTGGASAGLFALGHAPDANAGRASTTSSAASWILHRTTVRQEVPSYRVASQPRSEAA